MNCCKSDQCRGIEETFDTKNALSDLAEYNSDGPAMETRLLLDAIRGFGVKGASLLDVGGGIGAIQHQLMEEGAAGVVNVDASPAYSHTARQEAARLGYADRAKYYVGNFVDIAPALEMADIVTLDRVICCYDDMPALVTSAAAKAGRVLGLVFPVDRSWIRVGVGLANAFQRIMRRPFRIFAHSSLQVDALIRSSGFEKKFLKRGLFWQVVVYAKKL